jgi:hypothetical protein
LSNTFVEKHCCIRDVGLGLEVVGVESFAKGFRIGNVICDLAMIEVWSEGDETGLGQSRAENLHCVVQPPPGMKDQYTMAIASGGNGEVAIGLGMWHLHLLELL